MKTNNSILNKLQLAMNRKFGVSDSLFIGNIDEAENNEEQKDYGFYDIFSKTATEDLPGTRTALGLPKRIGESKKRNWIDRVEGQRYLDEIDKGTKEAARVATRYNYNPSWETLDLLGQNIDEYDELRKSMTGPISPRIKQKLLGEKDDTNDDGVCDPFLENPDEASREYNTVSDILGDEYEYDR